MNDLYPYDPILLKFRKKEHEELYLSSVFQQNRYWLRLVIGIGALFNLAYLFIDVVRFDGNLLTISFYGLQLILFTALYAATFYFRKEKYAFWRVVGVIFLLLMAIIVFTRFHIDFNEESALFLSYVISILLFVFSSIIGFQYRYSLLVNTIIISTYLIYIFLINMGYVASEQWLYVVTIYFVATAASYILDRQKLNTFINKRMLQLEKEKVERFSEFKNQLFAVIAHDLRGPYFSLKSILSLYQNETINEEDFKSLNQRLEKDFNSSFNLIENLLAWTKSQLNGFEIKPSKSYLFPEIKEMVQTLINNIEDKNINLIIDVDQNLYTFTDKESMTIVYRNLLSNAIKFTPKNGEIEISAQQKESGFLQLSFKDNGMGIEKGQLEKLFSVGQEFLVGSAIDKGAGLGLSLAKQFTELNGGKITVESEYRKGTTFTIKVPISKK